jgi:hypothetical protein
MTLGFQSALGKGAIFYRLEGVNPIAAATKVSLKHGH